PISAGREWQLYSNECGRMKFDNCQFLLTMTCGFMAANMANEVRFLGGAGFRIDISNSAA
ncbi:MAG: hypothetical protein ACXV8P_11565, partial [Methylobacter sp.]